MRAANQLLGVADPGTAEDTARWMLALQAQDFAGARWALALRGRSGETVADIHAALDGARIVRSWPLRGTLQITAAEDLRLLLAVSAERTIRATRTRRAQLGLEAEDLMHAEALALRLLADRRPMQRTQLMAAFDADGLDTSGQRGSHLLLHLALTRVVCFGPLEGRQHTVVLLDDWVPGPDPDRSGALRVLAPRYFTSHGPASVGDLAWWAGITTTEAAAATAEAAGGLIPLAASCGSAAGPPPSTPSPFTSFPARPSGSFPRSTSCCSATPTGRPASPRSTPSGCRPAGTGCSGPCSPAPAGCWEPGGRSAAGVGSR